MKKLLAALLLLLFALTCPVLVNAGIGGVKPPKLAHVNVVRVVDGDTIEVIMYEGQKEKVRLIGVDTPETKHPTKGVQPYGVEASNFTKEQLEGKDVWLEFDVQERDRYQRLLAYVWTEELHRGKIRERMFNARLLLEGYAQLATFPPNVRYVENFRTYQTEAREASRGLWALDPYSSVQMPQESAKKAESGYVGNKNSRVFHRPGCASVGKMSGKNRVELKNREDAVKQGFKGCGSCKP